MTHFAIEYKRAVPPAASDPLQRTPKELTENPHSIVRDSNKPT